MFQIHILSQLLNFSYFHIPFSVCDLCHTFTNYLVETKQAIRGIDLLIRAIRKIQLFDSQLTSIHADLYQLCLLSKCMKPALELLDTDVTGISSEVAHILNQLYPLTRLYSKIEFQQGGQNDSKHFLLCYYYGGMIYAAMKNYDRALYFFEVTITTPAVAVSYIMLEAHKKYILVSLILHGKVNILFIIMIVLYLKNIKPLIFQIQPIPKYTSHTHVVGRLLKPLSSPYIELAEPHATSSIQQVIEKYRETYLRDNNMGLVNQV